MFGNKALLMKVEQNFTKEALQFYRYSRQVGRREVSKYVFLLSGGLVQPTYATQCKQQDDDDDVMGRSTGMARKIR